MPREPLYPHQPKRRETLYPHQPKGAAMPQTIEIPLTPKQVDIVFSRFIDVGYDWVKFSPPVDHLKALPKHVKLLIPRDRLDEAISIIESAIDITRDWVSDPSGRAEHASTVSLYERVKAAKAPLSMPMTLLTGRETFTAANWNSRGGRKCRT